jgi:hypothetical protein
MFIRPWLWTVCSNLQGITQAWGLEDQERHGLFLGQWGPRVISEQNDYNFRLWNSLIASSMEAFRNTCDLHLLCGFTTWRHNILSQIIYNGWGDEM